MTEKRDISSLRQETLEHILEVARNLASTFDVTTILAEVTDAARVILQADRVSFFMYDHERQQLVLQAATRTPPVRIPADQGLVGECARTREVINVPDCYADPRFNPDVDRESGYRTRSLLSIPLIGFGNSMVGVMQLLNKRSGAFDADDERVAGWLAAQCAVALQRMRATEAMISTRKLRNEIDVAREIQLGTLPTVMPRVPGYDLAGHFKPTDQTGGDTYDLINLAPDKTFILLADATGHGIGPALSVTQVRAMIRVALRLGADLNATFQTINDQLVDDLPEGRFVTAFLGLLDSSRHQLNFHSGGQGPILHFEAAARQCNWYEPSTFPMGFMPQGQMKDQKEIHLEPGDILGLISDGVYEYENQEGRMFGMEGVGDVVLAHHDRPMAELIERLTGAMAEFGNTAPQFDDVTIVFLRRMPEEGKTVSGTPSFDRSRPSKRVREAFQRNVAELPSVFGFVERFIDTHRMSESLITPYKHVLGELFPNLVNVGPATQKIEIELSAHGGTLVCRITDRDVGGCEANGTSTAEVDQADDQVRSEDNLGLHGIRRLVDWIDYHYRGGCTTITFSKSP